MRILRPTLIFALAAIACRQSNAASAPRDAAEADAELSKAMGDPNVWASHGRDYTNQRYSPLSQITTGNVDSLHLAWVYHTTIAKAFETTPLVVDGTMYITTPLNHVVALDAATGAKKWEYTHDLRTTDHCCGPVNRGVAYYGGRLYMGTLDARLVALDARTGHRVWDVVVGDNLDGHSITAAPIAAKGMIITGISGGEYGIRGYVTAYDAATGKQLWRWYTIPSPADGGWWGKWSETDPFGTPLHRNIAQEKKDSATYGDAWKTGGGPMWQTPAIDLQRNLLIFATGNVSPDLDGGMRPGDNLYGNSIVALDLSTGKLKWYVQMVPHDVWDLDLASPVVLTDV
jgi:PQQ-dependent dehydrogenase (methanol/ethanol family)